MARRDEGAYSIEICNRGATKPAPAPPARPPEIFSRHALGSFRRHHECCDGRRVHCPGRSRAPRDDARRPRPETDKTNPECKGGLGALPAFGERWSVRSADQMGTHISASSYFCHASGPMILSPMILSFPRSAPGSHSSARHSSAAHPGRWKL